MNAHVPTWPGLSPRDVVRTPTALDARPFPFSSQPLAFYYRERNALYHLFRALRRSDDDWVAVPDYHHGNEVKAIRAAGFGVRFYPIGRGFTADQEALVALCEQRPRALLVIHYLGWAQPVQAIFELCRKLDIVTVEDCALSLLSEHEGTALGSTADHALFCLYKTLPVPNGGLLVHKPGGRSADVLAASTACGVTSLAARTIELAIEGVRGYSACAGGALAALKAKVGNALTRSAVRRWPVGDDGFDQAAVDLRMSALSSYLLERFDYAAIRERRRANFARLAALLERAVTPVREDLPAGMCPLFFPILVRDKPAAARALWARGIGAVEFWNSGDPGAVGPRHADALYLRKHVLELPIHQGLRPEQLEHMANEVRGLGLAMEEPS